MVMACAARSRLRQAKAHSKGPVTRSRSRMLLGIRRGSIFPGAFGARDPGRPLRYIRLRLPTTPWFSQHMHRLRQAGSHVRGW